MTQPTNDFSSATFNAPVNFASNYGNQARNLNIQTTEQNFDILLSDYKQFIVDIQPKYSEVTTDTAAIQTIANEVKKLPQARLQNFLNLKHLWNGGKKAAIKVSEHFAEENPWGKGAIAFLEGVTEDVE